MLKFVRNYLPLIVLVFPLAAAATTITKKTTGQLMDEADLIIHGQVISLESQFVDSGAVFTYIEVFVLDSLKGPAITGETVTLQFVGGKVEDFTFDIGVDYPQPGETGIYFLRDPAVTQLNPIVGWSQGHFIVDKTEVVMTTGLQPVIGFNRVEASNDIGFSDGVAVGVDIASEFDGSDFPYTIEALITPGLSVEVFKRLVIEGLAQ